MNLWADIEKKRSEWHYKLNRKGRKHLKQLLDFDDEHDVFQLYQNVDELVKSYPCLSIRLIDFVKFEAHGCFPRFPNNKNLTECLDEIDRDNSLFIFISHCWLRGNKDAEGWSGVNHPDSEENDKYKLCISGIKLIWSHLAPRMAHCYVWMDFGCIDQDLPVVINKDLERYDCIVKCCDAIFTPISDPSHKEWELPRTYNSLLNVYGAPLWSGGPQSYLSRGWCRAEMLYAANIPVEENDNPEVKRHTMFEAGLAFHCSENRRPHFLYGSKEASTCRIPRILSPLLHSFLIQYHPCEGHFSNPEDRSLIRNLLEVIEPFIEANRIEAGYVGDLNDKGQRHGKGRMVYEDGKVYEGDWKDGLCDGWGKCQLLDGNVYEGQWKNDKKNGHGSARYSDGNSFEGEWENGKRQGFGVYHYASGDVYRGEWYNDKRHGFGKMTYANGDVYEGQWRDARPFPEAEGTLSATVVVEAFEVKQSVSTFNYGGASSGQTASSGCLHEKIEYNADTG